MLAKPERREVFLLLAASLESRLEPVQEARLRELLGHEMPGVEGLPWPELHRSGRIMVGAWSLMDDGVAEVLAD